MSVLLPLCCVVRFYHLGTRWSTSIECPWPLESRAAHRRPRARAGGARKGSNNRLRRRRRRKVVEERTRFLVPRVVKGHEAKCGRERRACACSAELVEWDTGC